MEARASYGSRAERPRLTVVKEGGESYSALPHAVLFDERLECPEVVLYAVLQSYCRQGGECWAAHATLARQARCSERQLRRYLKRLVGFGIITERMRGQGQAKAYSLVHSASQADTGVRLNRTYTTASETDAEVNRTPVSAQQDMDGRFNRTPVSDPKKKKQEKKKQEEELAPTELGAASAAEPATSKATKQSRGTRCPETFPLEEKHFTYGAGLGFDEQRVRAETEKFIAHHRFKGTVGQDWYAGWQNWMRRAVQYSAPAYTNGSKAISPGRTSKQQSKWSDFKGRHGYKIVGQEKPDGR